MGEKQREIIGQVMPDVREAGGHRPDRDFHHALLPPHSAAAVRFQYRQRGASRRAAAAAFPLSAGCPPPTRVGAPSTCDAAVRRRAGGAVAFGGFGFGRGFRHRRGGRASQWAATDSGVLDRTLGRTFGVEGLYRPYRWRQGGQPARRDIPRSLPERSDRLRLFQDGCRRSRGRFSAPHPRKLRRHSGWRPRRAGAHHSGRRKRLGILRPQRPAVPARTLPAHFRGRAHARRHRERGAAADGARAARPHFPGSWINANFDVWIGAEEDNQAWTQLLRARQTYDAGRRRSRGAQRRMAHGRAADRRGQRLVLVVRAGARFRQPGGIRPAVSQPPGQRLPLPESDTARGALAAHSADDGAGDARGALRADHSR